jgi:hypothetical protein
MFVSMNQPFILVFLHIHDSACLPLLMTRSQAFFAEEYDHELFDGLLDEFAGEELIILIITTFQSEIIMQHEVKP